MGRGTGVAISDPMRFAHLACVLASSLVLGCVAGGGGDGGDDGVADDDSVGDDDVARACDEPGSLDQAVATLAGCGEAGNGDGDRVAARFSNPVNVAHGPDGQLYVADFDNGMIRVVDAAGTVSTLVAKDGFQRPFGLVFVGDTLYVSTDNNDAGDHSDMTGTIWRVDIDTGASAVVVRNIGRPRGLLALDDGRIVLSDYQHHSLRILEPTTATITNLAGTFDQHGMLDGVGAIARFDAPYGMARLPDGRILVADLFNNRIRAVALDGTVTTFAGTGAAGATDGAAASATFNAPQDLAIDGAGNVYVADLENFVVRAIAPDGAVSTLAGDGSGGWLDSDDLRNAQLYGLEGIDVAADGSYLWVADGSRGEPLPYHRIRRIELP